MYDYNKHYYIKGLGEEQSAKLKLRLGLNLRSHRAYAKLRFRTEPISPFDLGEGLSCAGKVKFNLLLLFNYKGITLYFSLLLLLLLFLMFLLL